MRLTTPQLDFVVIGAQKAGTTSLHQYLGAHPDVFMSRNKELHFFVEGLYGRNGWDCGWEKGWGWYEAQFAEAGSAVAIGESSPSYATYPLREGIAERIAASLPGVRLVYLLRHPVERARSEYTHNVINGQERRPIERALLEDPRYLAKSSYAMQVDQYLSHVRRDQLLLVVSERLRLERAATMQRIFEFLGVGSSLPHGVLDQEFHRTEQKAVPSRAGNLARRVPGYAMVARVSPDTVRRAYRVATRARHDPRSATVPHHVRIELLSRLGPDLERLRTLCPEAPDAWDL